MWIQKRPEEIQDLQAKQSVAVHWGTFALAYEYYLEPPVRLREALEQKGLKPESFFTGSPGSSSHKTETSSTDVCKNKHFIKKTEDLSSD